MRWFEIALVLLTLITGLVWLVDKLWWRKARAARAGLLDEKEPLIVDYSRAFFPVLAIVLGLRSFVAEPFRIPSSSMMPSLLVGDFILVNKFAYGLRLPVNNAKVVPLGEPKRGDVVVFRPPHHPDEDWIKRIVGLPGDTIAYRDDTVYINGQPLQYRKVGAYIGAGPGREASGATLLTEDLPGRPHPVLERNGTPYFLQGEGEWKVPPGQYFVMGDNRDNSEDSRFWPEDAHFLPEENLRGKAFLIWLNCSNWFCRDSFDASRIGDRIQ
jgi:signal peptidase I